MADTHFYTSFICLACGYEMKFLEPKLWKQAQAIGNEHKCTPDELKGAFAP